MAKKLVLVLNANQEYIKHTGDDEKKYTAVINSFFESISLTYLPLLRMIEKLAKDEVEFKISLVLGAVLCTLLEDEEVQKQYIEWLEKRIQFGQKEIQRTASTPKFQEIAKANFEKYSEDKVDFLRYEKNLVKKFHEFHKKGYVEILATCGTDIFMPLYNDMPEVMSAQIETGISAYRNFFGDIPEGFWLPELGYYPGVERILRSYGINYTILDSRSFLFSEIEPKNGLFTPARFSNALVAFGRDYDSDKEIFGEEGFARNEEYLNNARDVGFMLGLEELEPAIEKGSGRYSLGYKYWNNEEIDEDEVGDVNDIENIYVAPDAEKRLLEDAKIFVESKKAKLEKAENLVSENDVSMVITVSLDRLRSNWNEGISWLEKVIRQAASEGLGLCSPRELVGNPFDLQRIKPYYGSGSDAGYCEEMISSKNNWLMRYIRKASERMVDLSDRFLKETGLKARLLNLGAKELMFAQSSGWAKMINNDDFPEYAEMRFKQSINDFTKVFDALGSNTVSTEWLTKLESEHQVFPWMNYRIFSKKC